MITSHVTERFFGSDDVTIFLLQQFEVVWSFNEVVGIFAEWNISRIGLEGVNSDTITFKRRKNTLLGLPDYKIATEWSKKRNKIENQPDPAFSIDTALTFIKLHSVSKW